MRDFAEEIHRGHKQRNNVTASLQITVLFNGFYLIHRLELCSCPQESCGERGTDATPKICLITVLNRYRISLLCYLGAGNISMIVFSSY